MSRGVENYTCIISLNRFETTSRFNPDPMIGADVGKLVISDSIVPLRINL